MREPFFTVPVGPNFALRNVTAPRCLLPVRDDGTSDLCRVDLVVEHGVIAAIEPAGRLRSERGPDLDGSMVLPGLIDCHTHLDKGHIWPRKPNPTGDPDGAGSATAEDRESRWTADDVRRRMDFGLATAYSHGVVAIRTHLDSLAPQAAISFPVFCEARDRWAGRIDLQASSIAPLDLFLGDAGRELADIVAESGGQLGCATSFRAIENVPLPPEFDIAMTNLFALARERGLDVDLHVDETGDPRVLSLIRIAQIAIEVEFPGKILCGHCCSLALQTDAKLAETLDACFAAGIAIVSLPPVNMYLQSRHSGMTPRWRGTAPVHEIRARGLLVAVAGDNVRDPFYAYGDHDMLDTFTQSLKILQLDAPIGDWIAAATKNPAAIMRLANRGTLEPGSPADLIVLRARNYSELLSRHQGDRIVLRAGRAIDTTPPDYRELDDLMTRDLPAAS
jgi:cytosine deaminase